ncbi:PAS domain-containing hybrid sensor histidine kinase/response regulator [Christiangramia salexigens]|uniref:histidine kinase n=1 Tax=Christiangramia salexigens TaxID=1913577 RepID=A0A1L3J2Z8_9FLAO|nr:PAS domain-containing hybrid sensor histidine kinase/response regulator [Christiangramia salexigens]APG59497.1 hypothetical protein LPB144_03315 [Christiangramia salexigens]
MSQNSHSKYMNYSYESAEELYEEAPCGYVSFSSNGTIYNLNKTLLDWLGYQKEELVEKKKFQDLFKIGGKIFFETHFFPLIRIQGFVNEINFDVVKKDKTSIPTLINVKEIKGSSTESNRYRATIFDITDRKKYEKELLNAKLKAESASKAKAEFLATMSHEIRTPLNAIHGIANLIAKTPLNEQQREYSDILKLSSENLLGLINNLLDLSKIESKEVSLEKKSFSLRTLTDALMHTFEVKCREKGVELRSHIDDEIPEFISGDPIKLNQILINLIGNAIKFTSKGFISLEILLKEKMDTNALLEFKVRDTGIGIPEEKIPRIFQEFSQASYDISLEYGGTGLGLTICQKLLKLHDSSMEVNSEPGKGSEFSFEIEYDIYNEYNPTASKLFEEVEDKLFDAARVLVVEDNPINVFVISEYLKEWKLNYDTADNGQKAINAVKENEYDIILMDIHMPVMNGFEAASSIRSLHLNKQPIILALSATSKEHIQEKLSHSGIDDYISKPFGPEDLFKVLTHYLKSYDNPKPKFKENLEIKTHETKKQKNDSSENLKREPSFNLERLVKMANNRSEFLEKFIHNTSISFEDYLKDFEIACLERSHEKTGELIHKITMSVYYIQANRLNSSLSDFRESVKSGEFTSCELQTKSDEIKKEFQTIIRGLRATDAESLLKNF